MNISKGGLKNFVAVITGLLLLIISFLTYPSTSVHASIQPMHPKYKINPGEEKIIPFPQKNDPKFTIHIKVGGSSITKSSAPIFPNTIHCLYGKAYADWYAVNGFGSVVIDYKISVDFCFDGTNITSMTTPPHEATYTVFSFGLSHNASSTIHRSYGVALGNFQATGLIQTINGYVEVDVTGDGGYVGYTS